MSALTDAVQKLDLSKLSMRERILAVVTAAAVLWAYLGFFLMPMVQDVKSMRVQRASLKTEIDLGLSRLPVLQKQLSDLRRAERGKAVSEEFSGKTGDILPGGSRLSAILEELTRLARLRRIEFVSIRPDSVEDKGSFLQLRFRIDVKSRFRELGDYLLMLENLPRALIVNDLKIETQHGSSPSVLAHLNTMTYLGKD